MRGTGKWEEGGPDVAATGRGLGVALLPGQQDGALWARPGDACTERQPQCTALCREGVSPAFELCVLGSKVRF